MDVDLQQLPIPDWGLLCPSCRYPLKGLPRHRCPECGLQFDINELIRSWTRLREPRFTGQELPVPDFGLTCGTCGEPLTGAESCACPHCHAGFDLAAQQPPTPWFVLDRDLCGDVPIPTLQVLLAAEDLPHVPVKEKTLSEIYMGQSMTITRLRVPTEFFFETLWLIRHAQVEMEAARTLGRAQRWPCGQCGEENPGNFELCWNCGEARPS